MQPFLFETAQQILNNYKQELNDICIIFPNKRTALFFRKYFGQAAQKTIWSPNIFTIRAFIQTFARIQIADSLYLIFELYESFNHAKTKHKQQVLPFENFYQIGEIILNDFNEIDSNLIDVSRLYQQLSDYKQVETYLEDCSNEDRELLNRFRKHFSPDNLSKEKKYMLEMWELLPEVYKYFTEKLLQNNIGYDGLAFRKLTDLIDNRTFPVDRYKKYCFIGFNALNEAERKLFRYLKSHDKVLFFWDIDAYYMNNKIQEAGSYARQNIAEFGFGNGTNKKFPDNFNNTQKNIEVIGVPFDVGQAKALSVQLKAQNQSSSNTNSQPFTEKTAIILPDEHLLFPVLHSLPDNIKTINITMGYPLKNTSLYTLITLYFKAHEYFKKDEKNTYYFRDVIALLQHHDIWNSDQETMQFVIQQIEEANKIEVEVEFILSKDSRLLQLLFHPIQNGTLLLQNILNLLYEVYAGNKNVGTIEKHSLEDEYIYHVYTQIKRLKGILDAKLREYSFSTGLHLLKRILNNSRIPFSGEPLEGLQIMGVLEARNLDFETVFILNANEGTFPKINRKDTFIPESIRHVFKLPTVQQQDAVNAYYFYRILQRAKNIYLLYNNITANNRSGEASRYIQQIDREAKHKIHYKHLSQSLKPKEKKGLTIFKNDAILNELSTYFVRNQYAKKMFNASAINTYIDCRLKYYFKYIANLKEPTAMSDDVDNLMFGNILHGSIEKLYQHIKNNDTITQADFIQLKSLIEPCVFDAFKETLHIDRSKDFQYEGEQLVVKEVIKRHINNILQFDKQHTPFEIVNLEKKNQYTYYPEISVFGQKRKIAYSGTIDRLDKRNGNFFIIDYKTGNANRRFYSCESLFNRNIATRNRAALQMLFYCMVFHKTTSRFAQPALYVLNEMHKKNCAITLEFKQEKQYIPVSEKNISFLLAEFEDYLKDIIYEIFDTEVPFDQREADVNCDYCEFNTVCGRGN